MKNKYTLFIRILFLLAISLGFHSGYAQCNTEENDLENLVQNVCEGGPLSNFDVTIAAGDAYTGECNPAPANLFFDQTNSTVTAQFAGTHTFNSDLKEWHLIIDDGVNAPVDVALYDATGNGNPSADDNFGNPPLCYLTFTTDPGVSTTLFDLDNFGNDYCGTHATGTDNGTTLTNTQATINAALDGLDIANASITVQVYDCTGLDVGTLTDAIVTFDIGGEVLSFTATGAQPISDGSCSAGAAAALVTIPVVYDVHINWYDAANAGTQLATDMNSFTPPASYSAIVGSQDIYYNAECFNPDNNTYLDCPATITRKVGTVHTYAIPVISDVTSEIDCNGDLVRVEVTATINAANPGGTALEYALDATGPWQTSNIFTGTPTLVGPPTDVFVRNVSANNAVPAIIPANCFVSTEVIPPGVLVDNEPPTAVCNPNITIQLDANGNYTLTAAEVENGSTDNCGTAGLTYSIDEEFFDCDDIGPNTVVLFVEDAAGNIATCNSTVTVQDNVAPTATCQDITVQLDAAGNATIIAGDLDGGSTDNCSGVSLGIDIDAFTCADVGTPVNVTLTVTDAGGNTDNCVAVVTVEDNVAPTPLCQNITIQLDATGNAAITPAMIDNGSSDNCGLANVMLSQTAFTCADLGANTVTLTAIDNNGNFNTCNAIVTIEDITPPTASCQNIIVQLDATGNVSITAADVDNGSADNCGGSVDLSIDMSSFDCSNTGVNNVTLTVTDAAGNTDNCVAVVTVQDMSNPIAVCQNITVQLDAAGNAIITPAMIDNGSSDNCGAPTLSLDITTFDCTNTGSNAVVLTAIDASGNTNTCNATVIIEDNIAPMATCQNITVQLDATGNYTLIAAEIDNGSTDNCGVAGLAYSIDEEFFDCDDIGQNTVVLFVEDAAGNISTCISTVTVQESEAPNAVCQNITVQLDATGTATIIAADVDGGSTDNCEIDSWMIDVSSFTCADIGANNVTLTVTDASGNSDNCVAVVTVEDNVNPVAICQNITVQLDAAGNAMITTAMVDNGSFDNCNTLTLSLDVTTFDCTDVGANTVVLTANDGNGNTTTCNATVTVGGTNTTPSVVCNPVNVSLDINGNASIVDADIFDAASTAVCGEADRFLSQYNFTCVDVGVVSVTASIEDNNGNIGNCVTTVTVNDPFVTTMMPYDSVCINSPITLEAIQGRPGSTIHWYSDAAGNNTLNIGNPYTTQAITVNTTVWVAEQYGSGCMSPLVQVDIFVKDGDAPVISSNSPVCTREEIQLIGESGFINYQWTGPNGYSSSDQNPTISNADATDASAYSLVTISLDGCVSEAVITNVVVQSDVLLGTPLDADYTFCEDGEILVQPSLGGNQSGNWTGPNGFTSTTDVLINPANENLHEGMYTLVLTDNNTGCTSITYTTTILLTPRPVIADVVGGNAVVCPGEPFVLETEQLQGVTYFWEGPNGFMSSDNPIEITQADISNTGMYTVYASDGMCISDTVTTEVGMYPQPDVTISSNGTIFEQSETITLTANGGVAYQWTPITGIDDATSAVIDIAGLTSGIYTYEVFGLDLNTCLDSADITFEITPREVLEVNNVITPNGDGANDTWIIGFLENIDSYTINIIDRGGMQLYEVSDNYNNDWDGTYEGNDLPEGAYFYIIKTPQKLYRGGLTIVR